MELSDLYSEKVLNIAANAMQRPRLDAPAASVRKVSRLCGSVIEVDITTEDGVITAFGQDVRACALGQTSAAIVAREVIGTPTGEFRTLATQMRAMLKDAGAPPTGRWADLAYLEPVRDYPARHTSTLLVFDAICDALDRIEGKVAI